MAIDDRAHQPARHRRQIPHSNDDTNVVTLRFNRAQQGTKSERRESPMTEPVDGTPILDLLGKMTADSLAASSLDLETLALVRVAALVAVDAPAVSYLMNLEAAAELGIDGDRVRGVLAAIAPIVGTARIAAATGNIVKALAVEIEIAELDEQGES